MQGRDINANFALDQNFLNSSLENETCSIDVQIVLPDETLRWKIYSRIDTSIVIIISLIRLKIVKFDF